MAAYLVCHGTTPPQQVQTCGTAAWPNRHLGPASELARQSAAALSEQIAASATRPAARKALSLAAAGAFATATLAAVAVFAAVRHRKRSSELLL
jgi:disulfide bond formation protein DsbB